MSATRAHRVIVVLSLPLIGSVLLTACGGPSAVSSAGPASTVVSSAVAAAGSLAAPPAAPAVGSMSQQQISAVVCPALAQITADMAKAPYKPEAVLAQFTLKTLGSAQPDQYAALIAGADAAAKADCPADQSTVVKASGKASLSQMFSG